MCLTHTRTIQKKILFAKIFPLILLNLQTNIIHSGRYSKWFK